MARVTIATFPFPRDLMLVEARFQDEEIRYWLLDEHAHTVTHIGAGLGGVRMQVEQDNVGRAQLLLLEMGIHADEPDAPSLLVERLDRVTHNIPGIGQWSLLARLVTLSVVIGLVLSLAFHWSFRKSTEELLVGSTWCLTLLEQDELPVSVASEEGSGSSFAYSGCEESISFSRNGTVQLPGLNTPMVSATWEVDGDRILITDADTLSEFYEGVYSFHVDEELLALRSARVKLAAEAYSFHLPF